MLARSASHPSCRIWLNLLETALANSASYLQRPGPWPDPALLEDDSVTMAVQVNGRRRGGNNSLQSLTKDAVERRPLRNPMSQTFLDGKVAENHVVPGRIVNIVVA